MPRNRLFLLTAALLLLLLAACSSSLVRTDTPEAQETTPVQTQTPNSPQPPTPTEQPVAIITPIVAEQPIPSPTPACEAAPPTRIIVGERGQVTDDDPRPLNVRSGPGTEFRILGRLEALQVFLVLEGPRCGGNFAWYRVRRGNLEGWIAEGDPGNYYIEPYLPG
jgi:uncharacterized protein YgiM (DUF1202 family)